MGNDGGSIPDRRDLVKSKPKAEQADRANQARARWFFCALSKAPLAEPIVACALGKMYNKDALLEFLLDRTAYGDGEVICGHVRGMKDVKTLTLTANPALASSSSAADVEDTNHHGSMPRPRWVCPLTFKEMSGGVPFVYLTTCGCVFSRAGLSAVSGSAKKSDSPPSGSTPPAEDAPKAPEENQKELCPQCAAKFSSFDVVSLNPSEEEEDRMRLALTAARALEPVKVKKSKKRKADTAAADTAAADAAAETAGAVTAPPEAKKAKVTVTPQIAAASRALAAGLAMEEAKRKTNMSDAVKSLYKKDDARTQTWATMGTFTRYA